MWIDFEDGYLIVVEKNENFSSVHQSQLRYFGFSKKSKGEYIAQIDDPTELLERIIAYFLENGEVVELSSACKELVGNARTRKDYFTKLLSKARDYKNGNFDNTEFKKFDSFLKTHIKRKLRDHQKKAAYHLFLLGNAANFSVPGSGKTSATLVVYEKLRLDGLVNILFVIGPPACFGPWQQEFTDTLGRKPNCRILAGGEQNSRKLEYYNIGDNRGELYLTTFQTLLNDVNDIKKFLANGNTQVFLVVDEAHYIKQLGGEWAKAVLSLAPYAKYRCILTGTPIPRSYLDVFNMFDFLFPENPPLDMKTKSRIEYLDKQNNAIEAKKILESKIDPLIYRVRKKDLGLIPALFHPPILISMNKYERILYEAIVKKIRNYSKDDYLKNIDLVTRLMRGRMIRLRQCVSYSKLLKTSIDDYQENFFFDESDIASIIANYDRLEKPAKILRLLEMVKQFQTKKQKVVIWSNFRETLKLINKEIHSAGIKCEMIFGDTPTERTSTNDEKTREQIRDEFVSLESGLDVLIANPAACAESISLHKTCFHAIYYDLSYNCAQYLQSLDRIHRVGGSENKQANYYFLQYDNSVDQDIIANLNEKAERMYSLIETDYNVYTLDMFGEDDDIDAYQRIFGVANG